VGIFLLGLLFGLTENPRITPLRVISCITSKRKKQNRQGKIESKPLSKVKKQQY